VQLLDLAGPERGRRLVEQQDLRLEEQRLDDLEELPSPSRSASAASAMCSRVPPISTVPSSGARKPLAIPRSVDFPDPFSPTTACISPARHATLTSRRACTVPKRLETPWIDRTTGVSIGLVDDILGIA
jgi:hypothetical protein